MTVQNVGTRWVANPDHHFQICIPEHWKTSGYRDNPGLLIVQFLRDWQKVSLCTRTV